MEDVLNKTCPLYKLRYQKCDEAGARNAIHSRRPVVATFSLDENRWEAFSNFYETKPKETLTARDLDVEAGGEIGGHAVVLIRCDETSLTFMNSWGSDWGNNGFYTVDKASTLEVEGGFQMMYTGPLMIYLLKRRTHGRNMR